MNLTPPLRPAAYAEQALIAAILDGTYPAGSTLPAERELAGLLGITRPTLRETLQRLGRDGWLDIQHGKSTRIRDYRREGGLNVLNALVRNGSPLPAGFTQNLLQVRLALAPAYGRLAVERQAGQVVSLLMAAVDLPAQAPAYSAFDWRVHHELTVLSENPIYTLILNGFEELYLQQARLYFQSAAARAVSQTFYAALKSAAGVQDAGAAEQVIRHAMQQSMEIWERM